MMNKSESKTNRTDIMEIVQCEYATVMYTTIGDFT